MGTMERKIKEKQKRKEDILEAALKLFSSKGFENTTVDKIAQICELAKGTIYLYFKSKDEIFYELLLKAIGYLLSINKEAVEEHEKGIDKVIASICAYLKFYEVHQDYCYVLMYHGIKNITLDITKEQNKAVNDLISEIYNEIGVAFKIGKKDGSIRKDLNIEKIIPIIWAQTSGVIGIYHRGKRQFENKFNIDATDVIDYHLELLRYTIKAK